MRWLCAIGQMVAKRVKAGEAVDVLVVSRPQTESLEQKRRLVPDTTREIASMGVGVFVRKAPKSRSQHLPSRLVRAHGHRG